MSDRSYLSIGEVLSLLKDEFADITISKIRFLESQGLLDPERTPSGYRKFYENDIERLRWILRQQRENFLPLKVIKGRLGAEGEAALAGDDNLAPSAPPAAPEARRAPPAAPEARVAVPPAAPSRPPAAADPEPARLEPSRFSLAPQSGVSLSGDELASASGLSAEDLRDLEKYGLLAGRRVGGSVYYDEDAMLVANLAAGFMKFGVEARHLRMYKTAAEREAGFFEQVVMPMLKQRNPESRRQAVQTLSELAGLGEDLRSAMLRSALRQYTEP